MTTRGKMIQRPKKLLPPECRLIGDLAIQSPQWSAQIKQYFGEGCLQKAAFRIQTLEMACLLRGIDPKLLVQAHEEIHCGRID